MIKNKRVLAVITARGGSVKLPNKNILPFAGIPLVAHSIIQAKQSKYIDKVICSTDSKVIKNIALKYDCSVPFLRPKYLSKNTTLTSEVLYHISRKLKDFDYMILLQPTSPLRTNSDIESSIKLMEKHKAHSIVSVAKYEKRVEWIFNLSKSYKMSPVLGFDFLKKRRQDLRMGYILNGAIYVLRYNDIINRKPLITKESFAYLMPEERSIDIDTALDFKFAELVYKETKKYKV